MIGARTIDYRWETNDNEHYRYLYLQSNPVGWAAGLFGVFAAAALLLVSLFFPKEVKLPDRFMLSVFLFLWGGYMFAVMQISRVLYLYHYFLPLVFSFILFALVLKQIQAIGSFHITEKRRTYLWAGFALLLFASFQFYAPLTYYEPLTKDEFQNRNLLGTWELTCVGCEHYSPFVVPK